MTSNSSQTNWKQVRLGDICEQITDGKHGDCQDEADSGFYFLSAKDILDGQMLYGNARQITKTDFADTHKRTRLEPYDILLTNSGTIGRMALAPNEERTFRTTFQKSVAILKPRRSAVIPHFLYYLLLQENKRLTDFAGGTAQKNLLLRDMRAFPVYLPPLHIQGRIAGILSAYDDLIEDNSRRMKTLEEMARTIYHEWFVNFLFPGHDKFKTIESDHGSIPKGWEWGTVGDVLSTLESGSRPKGGAAEIPNGVPSIGAENIIGLGRYDYSKEKYVSREFFEKMNRGHLRDGDVLLYKDGAHIGRKSMFRDAFPHEECAINEHVFILRCNERCTQSYLFFWLDQAGMTQNIRNLNANAAQPGINQSGVRGLPILIPPESVLEAFDFVVDPMLSQLFNLAKKNNVLGPTRDLLLPKLISGELNVEMLDIPIRDLKQTGGASPVALSTP